MAFDPNPLFYEMASIFQDNYSNENKVIICNEGGTRCFAPNQTVITSEGSKCISDIKKGDKVQSLNESTKQIELKTVLDTMSFKNTKKSYRITLKTGETIECTQDHEFYYKGSWVSIKHVVSLWNDKNSNKH